MTEAYYHAGKARGIFSQSPALLAAEIRFTSLDPLGAYEAATDVLAIEAKSRVSERPACFLPERALVAYAAMLCVHANLDEALATLRQKKRDMRSILREAAKADLRAGLEKSYLVGMRQHLSALMRHFGNFRDTFSSVAAYIKAAGIRYATGIPFDWWRPVHEEIFQVVCDRRLAMGDYARDAFTGFLRNLESTKNHRKVNSSEQSSQALSSASSRLRDHFNEIDTLVTVQALGAKFDECLRSVIQARPANTTLDSEITAILTTYHVLHRGMQLLMRDLYALVNTQLLGSGPQNTGLLISPVTSRLMNLLEGMYENFASTFRQSFAMQTRCFADAGQYAALTSDRLRWMLPFDTVSTIYVNIFEKFLISSSASSRFRNDNGLRQHPAIDQQAHMVWGTIMVPTVS